VLTNELGVPVPPEIEQAAIEWGCLDGVKYVYRDGEYGFNFPMASILSSRITRFRSDNYEANKVELGGGWVAFMSPSAARSGGNNATLQAQHADQAGCLICGEKWLAPAFFPAPEEQDGEDTIPLCRQHHIALENGQLHDWEWTTIWQKCYSHLGLASLDDFLAWAHRQGYPFNRCAGLGNRQAR
jgi:hypothetical protein